MGSERVPGAVTINKNGTMLVDLAQAEKLLAGMSVEMQLEMTNIMFEPILRNAMKMREALERIAYSSQDEDDLGWYQRVAREALPK